MVQCLHCMILNFPLKPCMPRDHERSKVPHHAFEGICGTQDLETAGLGALGPSAALLCSSSKHVNGMFANFGQDDLKAKLTELTQP